MQTEPYQGFVGEYDYDPSGELFIGCFQGSQQKVYFQGIYRSEMQLAFEEAVEEYLEMCRELGERP